MDIKEKLDILSSSAKFDVDTEPSIIDTVTNLENDNMPGSIYYSKTSNGKCMPLLKVLFSNSCIYDCAYCINRRSNNIPRATFKMDELINLTLNLYKRKLIRGLFLSSAVFGSPNTTMNTLYLTAKKLREEHNFPGYIHLKIIPGADLELIKQAGFYADRMSVNLELPSEKSLSYLAPDKNKSAILSPMNYVGKHYQEWMDQKNKYKYSPTFIPSGQSTQLVIGASPESDFHIIKLVEKLYLNFHLTRVYYSAFQRVNQDYRLPNIKNPPVTRKLRLYQADWLMRYYGFSSNEILNEEEQFLDDTLDPKTKWALRNYQMFPVEINSAPYELLIKVPGIGLKSAKKIISYRKKYFLNFENLKNIGVALKRARFFITCNGKYYGKIYNNPDIVRSLLTNNKQKNNSQLSLFEI
ncbi:MAG: putative DNA modification/repair radical SAM protein [Defluviitoga tunisiensis]|jgi:putative DNA modification/repair radical SAM protein